MKLRVTPLRVRSSCPGGATGPGERPVLILISTLCEVYGIDPRPRLSAAVDGSVRPHPTVFVQELSPSGAVAIIRTVPDLE